MVGNRQDIKFFYRISLVEGEGLGTAYEYYTKSKRLQKFLDVAGRPKRILIAGLPEKYGYSMDFFLLAEMFHGEVLALDDRADRIERAQQIYRDLVSKGILNGTVTRFSRAEHLGEIDLRWLKTEEFDLALSCEVLQRLNRSREEYISRIQETARSLAVFVPNRGNASHTNRSGLKSMYLEELLKYYRHGINKIRIHDTGLLDMPPFPPGLSRSQERREQAAVSGIEGLLMKALEVYSSFEGHCPKFFKAKFAHIAYVMATR